MQKPAAPHSARRPGKPTTTRNLTGQHPESAFITLLKAEVDADAAALAAEQLPSFLTDPRPPATGPHSSMRRLGKK